MGVEAYEISTARRIRDKLELSEALYLSHI